VFNKKKPSADLPEGLLELLERVTVSKKMGYEPGWCQRLTGLPLPASPRRSEPDMNILAPEIIKGQADNIVPLQPCRITNH